MYKTQIRLFILALALVFSSSIVAQPSADLSAVETLNKLVDQGFEKQKQWQQLYKENPEKFFDQFEGWARTWFAEKRIVARILGKKHYKNVPKALRLEFADKVISGIVSSYSSNILNASRKAIIIKGVEVNKKGNKAKVEILIKTSTTDIPVFFAYYKGKAEDSVWLVENLYITGLNAIGILSKSFDRELLKNRGNYKKTIDNWNSKIKEKEAPPKEAPQKEQTKKNGK